MDLVLAIFNSIRDIFSWLLALGVWLVDNLVLAMILVVALAIFMYALRFIAGALKIAIIIALIVSVLAVLVWFMGQWGGSDNPISPRGGGDAPVFNNLET